MDGQSEGQRDICDGRAAFEKEIKNNVFIKNIYINIFFKFFILYVQYTAEGKKLLVCNCKMFKKMLHVTFSPHDFVVY